KAITQRRRIGHYVAAVRRRVRAAARVFVGIRPVLRPGVEVGLGPAEGEACEFHEGALIIIGALADEVGRQLEAAAVIGLQYAVFGLGPDVERDDRARTRLIVGGIEAVVASGSAGNIGVAGASGVAEVLVVAHPAADLETGIGARDVEEAFAVQAADLHVFDRLGLDRKVGRLRPG